MDRRKALAAIGLSPLAGALLPGMTKADEEVEVSDSSGDDELIEMLFVQESFGMRSDGRSLTLVDADPYTLWFANRPQELAGYLAFEEFINLVATGPDNFEVDPPNATLVILGGDELINVVMAVPDKPSMENGNIIFPTINVIEGELPAEGGASAFFIDVIGRPLSPGSVAGVHRRHRRRRRRAT